MRLKTTRSWTATCGKASSGHYRYIESGGKDNTHSLQINRQSATNDSLQRKALQHEPSHFSAKRDTVAVILSQLLPQAFVHHVGRGFKLSRNFLSCSVINPSEPGQRFSPKKHGDRGHFSLCIKQWHLQNLLLFFKASRSVWVFVFILTTHSVHCSFFRPSFLKWSIIFLSNFFHPYDIWQCWQTYVSTSSGLYPLVRQVLQTSFVLCRLLLSRSFFVQKVPSYGCLQASHLSFDWQSFWQILQLKTN